MEALLERQGCFPNQLPTGIEQGEAHFIRIAGVFQFHPEIAGSRIGKDADSEAGRQVFHADGHGQGERFGSGLALVGGRQLDRITAGCGVGVHGIGFGTGGPVAKIP